MKFPVSLLQISEDRRLGNRHAAPHQVLGQGGAVGAKIDQGKNELVAAGSTIGGHKIGERDLTVDEVTCALLLRNRRRKPFQPDT